MPSELPSGYSGIRKVLKDRFKDRNVKIIKESIGEDKTKIIIKESIWIGLHNYRIFLRNKEFAQFARANKWYQLLLIAPFLILLTIYTLSRKMKNYSEKFDLSLKIGTGMIIVVLILITWPNIFHEGSRLFYKALRVSLQYLLVVPPIQIASFLLAVLINQKIKGIKFFRTLYYLPVISGVIIVGYCWRWVFNPSGLLNGSLQMVRILESGQKIYWLDNPNIALWSLMFVTFWRGLGYYMVIYLAGLQSVSNDLLEAAMIDGASKFQLLTKIIFPLMKPTILICSILSTISALKIFQEIFVMTQGSTNTTSLLYFIYEQAFGGDFRFGQSSALTVLLFFVICFFTIINFKINKRGGFK